MFFITFMLTFKLLGKCYLVRCPGALRVAPWFYTSEVARLGVCPGMCPPLEEGKGRRRISEMRRALRVTLLGDLYLQIAKH